VDGRLRGHDHVMNVHTLSRTNALNVSEEQPSGVALPAVAQVNETKNTGAGSFTPQPPVSSQKSVMAAKAAIYDKWQPARCRCGGRDHPNPPTLHGRARPGHPGSHVRTSLHVALDGRLGGRPWSVDEAQPPRTSIVRRADARLDPGLRRDDGAHKLTFPCEYRRESPQIRRHGFVGE